MTSSLKVALWETAWGWQAAAAGPGGLYALTLPREKRAAAWAEILAELEGEQPGLESVPLLNNLAGDCRSYFRGQRVDFSSYPLDLGRRFSPFSLRVLEAARSIPYGEVRTYGEVARLAGHSRAARAAGGALGKNPLPLLVP